MEFGARVTLRLGLEKGTGLKWPTVETEDTFACLASAPEFYDAAEIAVRNMVDVLGKELRMEPVDAYMLVSARGDLRLNQACRSPSTSTTMRRPSRCASSGSVAIAF